MAGSKKEYSLGFIIGAQLKSSFPAAFKKVEKNLLAAQKAAQNCGKAWSDFGKNAGKLVAGVAGAATAVTVAVWKMTDSVAEQAEVINHNAATLKMTSEEYQKLQYAFKKAGIGGDEFVGIMTQLDETILKAAKNTKAAKAFEEATGLSAEKLARMDPSTRVERMADYLNSIQDPLKKDEVAMELFGKSALEMERILSMGSEGIHDAGQELVNVGGIINDETVAQAKDYADMKKKLTTQIDGIKTQLTEGLLPAFTTVFGTISDLLKDVDWKTVGESIATWVNKLVENLPTIIENVRDFIDKVSNGVQSVVDFVGGWDNLWKIVLGIIAMKTAFGDINKVISAVQLVSALGPWGWAIMAIVAAIGLVILYWEDVKAVAETVCNAVKAFFRHVGWTIRFTATQIKNAWNAAITAISNWWNQTLTNIRGFVTNLKVWVNAQATAISIWFKDKVSAIAGFFSGMKVKINGYATSIKTWWKGVATAVHDWWNEKVSAILAFFDPIISFFSGIGDTVGGHFTTAWNTIKTAVEGFVKNILDVFQPVADFFSGIGAWITDLFGGKKTVQVEIQGTMHTSSGGETYGGGGASIPGHATGGIFNRPHLASFAENAPRVPEAAIPIENTPRSRSLWEQTGRMAGFTQGSGGGGPQIGDINISIPISGTADAETVKQIKAAADDLTERMRSIVRSEWSAMQREKARLSFT